MDRVRLDSIDGEKAGGLFAFKNTDRFKGTGFIVLNVFRVCNIIVLLVIGASSVVLMINGGMPGALQFFKDVSLAFVTITALLLIVTELGINKVDEAMRTFWPLVGNGHGFTTLGVSMLIFGAHLLGELGHAPNTVDTMFAPFYNLCYGGGILSILFGIFNIILSWLYRAGGISARAVRRDGTLAEDDSKPPVDILSEYDSGSSTLGGGAKTPPRKEKKSFSRFFGRGAGKGDDSLEPRPYISQPVRAGGDDDLEQGHRGKPSPMVSHIAEPDNALHPSHTLGNKAERQSRAPTSYGGNSKKSVGDRSSTYSVASHASQF